MLKRAAVGLRPHSGWTALVALGESADAPVVLRRERVELCHRGIYRQGQPYHAAAEMELKAAEVHLAECARTAAAMAQTALEKITAELLAKGYRVGGCCVLTGSGKPLPDLPRILAAHPLIHTAEGVFFREAVRHGGESAGLAVCEVKERELDKAGELFRRVASYGELVGPPWREDQKLCAMAAWMLLAVSESALAKPRSLGRRG